VGLGATVVVVVVEVEVVGFKVELEVRTTGSPHLHPSRRESIHSPRSFSDRGV